MSTVCVRTLSWAMGVVIVVGGVLLGAAGPASAACVTNPTTNPITIDPGPPFEEPIVIPGVSEGIVAACVEVEGNPDPQVDTNPTVDVVPFGCGAPCFVVEWDGVTTQPVTISGGVGDAGAFQRTVPGRTVGELCVNAGQPCPPDE